jgi:hypothetical protein
MSNQSVCEVFRMNCAQTLKLTLICSIALLQIAVSQCNADETTKPSSANSAPGVGQVASPPPIQRLQDTRLLLTITSSKLQFDWREPVVLTISLEN